MQRKPLGRTGLQVSTLCFGSLTLGPLQNNLSVDEGAEVIAAALDAGVNFIDTAQLYQTYPYIREGLRRSGHDAVISSKTYAYTARLAREAVEEARQALDRDMIDIFLLHEQESEHTLEGHREALEELYRLKGLGILRAVGLSTHHVAGVRAAVQFGLDVVHPLLNKEGLGIVDGGRPQMEDAVKSAYDAGLGVFSMKALGGGHLYRSAAEALTYVRGLPYIHAVAVGMKTTAELMANLAFWASGQFAPEDLARLEEQTRRLIIEDHCVGCGACVRACPSKALHVDGGRVQCDGEACVLCGYCGASCREFCIKIV